MKIKSTATVKEVQTPFRDPTRETKGKWLLDVSVKSHIAFSIPQCIVTPESEITEAIGKAIYSIPKLRYGAYSVYNISEYVRECLDSATLHHLNKAKIMSIANAFTCKSDVYARAEPIDSPWLYITDRLRTIRSEGFTGEALEAAKDHIQSVANRDALKHQVFIQLCLLAIDPEAGDIYVAIGHGIGRVLARHNAGKFNDEGIDEQVMLYLDDALDIELEMEEEEAEAEAQAQPDTSAPRHDVSSLTKKLAALQVILRELEKVSDAELNGHNKAETTAKAIDALSASESGDNEPRLFDLQEFIRKQYDNR